jgi:uncharacterized protein (DUF362 family)/NAD-dependent dihydropyrimidine dehydrogenase PreA subunit
MDEIYHSCGVKEYAQECGFRLLYPDESVIKDNIPLCWWSVPEQGKGKGFQMVNLPKLKTHDLAVLTLAVKNLYGCISGLHKSHLHRLYPRTEDLVEVLIWLYNTVKPKLNLVDGILAMEGEGPAKKGTPRKLGIVVVGNDALHTDYIIGKLVGLNEQFNPLIKVARSKGMISDDKLEVIYQKGIEPIENFKFPRPFIIDRMPSQLLFLVKLFLRFRPAVETKKCTGCKICREVCPNHAITIRNGKAVINYEKCTMCMCCGEMCRFGAVSLKKGLLLKMLDKFL